MIHHSLSKARQFTSKWQCCVEPSSEYRRRNGWCPTTPDLCMHLQKHHWFFRSYHWKRLEKGFWMGNMTIISHHAGKFIASQDGEMEKRLRLFWGSLASGPRSTMIWFGKIIRSTKIQTKWKICTRIQGPTSWWITLLILIGWNFKQVSWQSRCWL